MIRNFSDFIKLKARKFALFLFHLALIFSIQAQSVFEAIGREVNTLFEKSVPAVVRVKADQGGILFVGSGFFIDAEGTLLTAFKVLQESKTASVEWAGKKYTARVLGSDMYSRLAMLKIEAKTPDFLKFAANPDLRPGQSVVSVGYPFDLPAAPSFGMISGMDVSYQGMPFATRHIRAGVALSPGQIGGPLLNTKGEVVGVIVTAIEEGKACYALPAPATQKIASDFLRTGSACHGWVGVDVVQDDALGQDGRSLRVRGVRAGTPAERSGLRPGDVIVKIGGHKIEQPADILDAAFFSQVGQKMTVTVSREGKLADYLFTISERPKTAPMVSPGLLPESITPDKLPVLPARVEVRPTPASSP